MTQIKIEVPANDTIALNAFAEALQRIAAERAPSTTMIDMIKQFENVKTPKGDDYIEQVIDETSSVESTPASGEKLYDAEIERMNTEYADDVNGIQYRQLPGSLENVEVAYTLSSDTLDADGIPHDKRIHSKGATRLADDTWRLKRKPADKTDEEWDEYVKSVKAELKAVQDIPSVELNDGVTPPEAELTVEQAIKHIGNANDNPMDVTPPVVEAPLTPPVIDEPATQLEGVTPNGDVAIEPPVAPVGAPVAPVTPPTSLTPPVADTPSDQPSVTTFQELMLYITSNAKKRGADNDMIRETLLEVDPALTAIPLIATRADLIPKFVTALEAKLS